MFSPELIQTPKVFKDRLYIDGVKGFKVSHQGQVAFCAVSFKMSFNANFSLEHFFRPVRGIKFSTTLWGLKTEHIRIQMF